MRSYSTLISVVLICIGISRTAGETHFICNGTTDCSNIRCTDTDHCMVQCISNNSCYGANIVGPVNRNLDVICSGSHSCDESTITSTTGSLVLTCSGAYSCNGGIYNASTGADLIVKCGNLEGCDHADFYCPTYGECDIDCLSNGINVCTNIIVNASNMVTGSLSFKSNSSSKKGTIRCPGNDNECVVYCGLDGCESFAFYAQPDTRRLEISVEGVNVLKSSRIYCPSADHECLIRVFGNSSDMLSDTLIYTVRPTLLCNYSSFSSNCYGDSFITLHPKTNCESPNLCRTYFPTFSPSFNPTFFPSLNPTRISTIWIMSVEFEECSNDNEDNSACDLDEDEITQHIRIALVDHTVQILSGDVIDNTMIITLSISISEYAELDKDTLSDLVERELEDDYGDVDVTIKEDTEDKEPQPQPHDQTLIYYIISCASLVSLIVCVCLYRKCTKRNANQQTRNNLYIIDVDLKQIPPNDGVQAAEVVLEEIDANAKQPLDDQELKVTDEGVPEKGDMNSIIASQDENRRREGSNSHANNTVDTTGNDQMNIANDEFVIKGNDDTGDTIA
eukprot:1011233_1